MLALCMRQVGQRPFHGPSALGGPLDPCQLPLPFKEKAQTKEKWPVLGHPTHWQPGIQLGRAACQPSLLHTLF